MRPRVRRRKPGTGNVPGRAPRQVAISDAVADFLEDPSQAGRARGGRRAAALRDIDAAMLNAEGRARTGDWEGADGRTMVGLYAWCHRLVYGVKPVELEVAGEFRIASRAALRILHQRFDDDPAACAIFIRWSWRREKERAEWARANRKDRNRMGWRLQFSDRQVTDFRVALQSKRGA